MAIEISVDCLSKGSDGDVIILDNKEFLNIAKKIEALLKLQIPNDKGRGCIRFSLNDHKIKLTHLLDPNDQFSFMENAERDLAIIAKLEKMMTDLETYEKYIINGELDKAKLLHESHQGNLSRASAICANLPVKLLAIYLDGKVAATITPSLKLCGEQNASRKISASSFQINLPEMLGVPSAQFIGRINNKKCIFNLTYSKAQEKSVLMHAFNRDIVDIEFEYEVSVRDEKRLNGRLHKIELCSEQVEMEF